MELRIFKEAVSLLETGAEFALVTIIGVTGSAPRGVGTKMLVLRDGTTIGTIGGDVLEAEVVSLALKALEEGKSRIVNLKLSTLGMLCGGSVEIFIDVIRPAPELLIIGGGYLGNQLAKKSHGIFRVKLIEPNPRAGELPESVQVIQEPLEQAIPKLNISSNTYVVIMVEASCQLPCLEMVLKTPAAYIGMVGSRGKAARIYKYLIQKGISEQDLQRVYIPVGLDIGAKTPEEISISILAELIKLYRNPEASGRSLRFFQPKLPSSNLEEYLCLEEPKVQPGSIDVHSDACRSDP